MASRRTTPAKSKRERQPSALEGLTTPQQVEWARAALAELATPKDLANLVRFGITATQPLGVAMTGVHQVAKRMGRNHALAEAIWQSGIYEMRLLCSFIDSPDEVTVEQMNRWIADCDNWAVCDTLCFHLFHPSPHAWGRVDAWAKRKEEFVKRGAFALMARIRSEDESEYLSRFPLLVKASSDERNFVKKGVSWALRSIGQRSRTLHTASVELARELSTSETPSARWIGKDALRDLQRPLVLKKLD